ncbi:adenylate kinase isoenzyme 6-like [Culicoides brevitarsis]|uniref:adenylate kinase isoenzyme 6-like n=1 Tax=Culicoides brevitarsis TaxID=469753 RepID=UPI00307C75E9
MPLPNILVTGTPGSGKSHMTKILAEEFNLKHQDVADIVKEHHFTDGYDETLECPILDEKKLVDFLDPIMRTGGNLVEYHNIEFFPERWFSLVLVVRCDTNILFKRLEHKGYNSNKIKQYVEMEIFQMALEEAKTAFKRVPVHQVRGETEDDVEKCVAIVKDFLKNW